MADLFNLLLEPSQRILTQVIVQVGVSLPQSVLSITSLVSLKESIPSIIEESLNDFDVSGVKIGLEGLLIQFLSPFNHAINEPVLNIDVAAQKGMKPLQSIVE